MSIATRATLDDLLRIDGKAELVGGRIVEIMPSGEFPSAVSGEIFASLRNHAKKLKRGRAYPDGIGYAVAELVSGRESFSPDASYYDGPQPPNRMRFIQGSPTFAAEVRSENDYGAAAEEELAAKRRDYFTAGTQVVWDVDPKAKTIAVYRAAAPDRCVRFGVGQEADAEPSVPGWTMKVDELFAD